MTDKISGQPASGSNTETLMWVNPDSFFDALVVLTSDALFISESGTDKKVIERTRREIAAGANPQTAMGTKAKRIRLAEIKSVDTNQHGIAINIKHHVGTQQRRTSLSGENKNARDRIFNALRQRLGSRFRLEKYEFGILQSMVGPSITAGIIVLLTWLCSAAASDISRGKTANVHGRAVLIKVIALWFMQLLGPTGVTVVGVILLVIPVIWFVDRVRHPPIMLYLKKP